MHPAGAGAGAVAVGAVMDMRAAVRVNVVFGLAMAAMGVVAANINPGAFYAQVIEDAAPEAQQCAATEAEALRLRGAALLLVLMGVAQALVAAAADVAVAGSLRGLGRWLAASAHLVGAISVSTLCYVVHGAAVVAVGHCAGEYQVDLGFCYFLIALSYVFLLGISLVVTFF